MLTLNYRDARPIYEQIKDGLRKLIVTGALGPDEKLPSVRAMATQLAINPNTIQRAYAELERQGYIYSIKGKGNFVAQTERLQYLKVEELRGRLAAILDEAQRLGMSDDEIIDFIRGIIAERSISA